MSKFVCILQAIMFSVPSLALSLSGAEPVVVNEMQVVLIDSVDVPASQDGAIAALPVEEGESVSAGDELARLDDRSSALHLLLETSLQQLLHWSFSREVAVMLCEVVVEETACPGCPHR